MNTTKANIVGIGVDVVEVERIKQSMERQKEYFLKKVFSDMEVAYCKSRKKSYVHFAARFAAKEAVAKAMRTGWSGAFHWREVEVVNDSSGAPHVVLTGEVARALKDCKLHLSISHTDTTVIAFVVMEQVK